jgi:putative flippase GtrA
MAVSAATHITQNVHARRFVKFCIVGASSTAIQLVVLKLVQRMLGSSEPWAVMTASTVGVLLAILNGFWWNRHWTFRQGGTSGMGRQFVRFVAVNIVGLTLNTLLMYLFYVRLRLFHGFPHPDILSQLLTIACVVSWNFFANTKWTFREPESL